MVLVSLSAHDGLELTDFSTIHAAAQVWLDTIAKVRIHGETAGGDTGRSERAVVEVRVERSQMRTLLRQQIDGSLLPSCNALW